jgi:hypothetical protein
MRDDRAGDRFRGGGGAQTGGNNRVRLNNAAGSRSSEQNRCAGPGAALAMFIALALSLTRRTLPIAFTPAS